MTVLVYDEPLLPYQVKENQFFHEVAAVCLKTVLEKHGLAAKIQSTLKTSSSVFKSLYVGVCAEMSDRLEVASANSYDIIDCFYDEYQKTKDSRSFG